MIAALALLPVAVVRADDATASSAAPGYVMLGYADNSCALATVDLATGAVAPIGTPSESNCGNMLAIAPDSTLYGISGAALGDQYLLRYDVGTGVPTQIGDLGYKAFLAGAGGLTFGVDGSLWLEAFATGSPCASQISATYCLYRVDSASAATTLVGSTPGEPIVNGLAPRCDGPLLTAHVTPPQQLATVDTATAVVTDLGSLGGGYFVHYLAAGPDGSLWGVGTPQPSGGQTLLRIDPETHTITASVPLAVAADTAVLGLAIPGGGCVPAPPRPPSPPAPLAPATIVLAPTFTG